MLEKTIFETNSAAMLRTLFCTLFMVVLAGNAGAQGLKPQATGVGIIYNRETTFNFRVSTNRGFVPGVEFGRLRSYYRTTYYHLSLGELKHPKEQRQSADPRVSRSFRPWVYGKQNNFFVARGAWGVKRYYSEKARQRGVAVGISYAIGPTLGILKPYYLALQSTTNDPSPERRIVHERYTAETAELFLDNTKIVGASPFTKGFSQASVLPGGNASIAFHMDWGAFDEFVKALELGIMVDAFPKPVPILVSEANSPVFFNFFINLQLGKRQ
jgi:hypothetical protein